MPSYVIYDTMTRIPTLQCSPESTELPSSCKQLKHSSQSIQKEIIFQIFLIAASLHQAMKTPNIERQGAGLDLAECQTFSQKKHGVSRCGFVIASRKEEHCRGISRRRGESASARLGAMPWSMGL